MLFRKLLRDIKLNKMLFLTIFLLSFFGVFVYTGIGGEIAGVRNVQSKFNKETDLANAWIYGEAFNEESVKAVEAIDGVKAAQGRIYVETNGVSEAKPKIHLYFETENVVSKPKIVEGDAFDPKDNKRIWIDKRFADATNLKVGDDYTVDLGGMELTLQIGGLFYSSEYTYYTSDDAIFPDFAKIGIAYASYDALPQEWMAWFIQKAAEKAGQTEEIQNMNRLQSMKEIPFTQIIMTTDKKDVASLEKKVDQALNGKYSYFITRKSVPEVNQLYDEMKQHESMIIIFATAFLGIAILAIITTMNRMVNNQRTQIGTMKALGLKKNKIIYHYLSYGFYISFVGAVLGLILGPITIPNLVLPSMKSAYTLPEWKGGYSTSFYVVAALTVVACTVTTYLSCRKVLGINPANTLRPAVPKAGKHSIFEKIPFWKHFSFYVQYNLRDFSRSKIRCLMGLVGTLSCMALLVCSTSMYDSFKHMSSWLFEDIQNYETKVSLKEEAPIEEVYALEDKLDGEGIMEDAAIVRVHGKKKTLALTATEGKGKYRITDVNLNSKPVANNEFAITQKTAKILGVSKGDEVEWHLIDSEEWIKTKITIINRMPIGSGITTTKEVVEDAGYKFRPTYIATNQPADQISSNLVKKTFTKSELLKAWDKSMEVMSLLIVILVTVAVLLALLILYNLGLIAYTEREKEMATLKVMGFDVEKLRKMLLIQNTWLSIAGIIGGVPVGLLLVQYMVDLMGESYDMTAMISLPSFFACAFGTLIVSVLVSLMFSGKLKRLDMVASLKGME